jgi:hypothetical protein
MIDLIKRYFKQYLSLKYRIVTDRFAGYECQVTLFGLFWYEMGGTNTQFSIEKSLDYIYRNTGKRFKFLKLKEKLYEQC